MRKQNGMLTKATGQKMQMCKIQDGERPPFWMAQSRDQKMKFFGIQNGGNRHRAIRFFGHNSSTDCPISAKFCMGKQNGVPTKATW